MGKAVHMAWNKRVNTDRKTLDVEELIDWESIHIPRRTAQECKDEWCTLFDPYAQPVCLRRDKWFWRIQYYPHMWILERKPPGTLHLCIMVSSGLIHIISDSTYFYRNGAYPREADTGYEYIHDFAHTGVSYLHMR